MKSPGTILREARERRGLTLADVAAVTRIPRTMLEHLENDRHDEYSAEVFARGHLSNVARELGLDPREVLHHYEGYAGKGSSSLASSPSRTSDVQIAAPPSAPRRPQTADTSRTSSSQRRSVKRVSTTTPRSAHGARNVRPSHVVAVFALLFGIIMLASMIHGNRATANNTATYPEPDQQDWELERDAREARWLLEQPDTTDGAPRDDDATASSDTASNF